MKSLASAEREQNVQQILRHRDSNPLPSEYNTDSRHSDWLVYTYVIKETVSSTSDTKDGNDII
jgi:hypothetical protein